MPIELSKSPNFDPTDLLHTNWRGYYVTYAAPIAITPQTSRSRELVQLCCLRCGRCANLPSAAYYRAIRTHRPFWT